MVPVKGSLGSNRGGGGYGGFLKLGYRVPKKGYLGSNRGGCTEGLGFRVCLPATEKTYLFL